MCELFALSSSRPTDVRFSLEAFARHGGLEGPHKDGWGIAYYDEGDVRLIKEPHAAADSACVRFIQDHPFRANLVVSHVRRATRGTPALRNCQPFVRELGGRMHVFAHNGDLDPDVLAAVAPPGRFRPVGETDSERAFCALLAMLEPGWAAGVPPLEWRLAAVARFAAALRPLGPANYLYTDGDALFVHAHRRHHGDGRPPHPPGLHLLCRRCVEGTEAAERKGRAVAVGSKQEVVLAASVPLTREPGWQVLAEGELVVVRQGRIVLRRLAATQASIA